MVVEGGVTDVEPEAATVPIAGEMVTLTAFVVVQVSTAVSPASRDVLLALNALITGGATCPGITPGISGG